MESANFYWTLVVGIISASWAIITLVRDRRSQAIEHTNKIVDRLLEDEHLLVNNPEIQMYLSQNARQDESYFRNEELLSNPIFYKAKALVYKHINLFDEILSLSARPKWKISIIKPLPIIELSDWENYIRCKLRHPFYQSVLSHEKGIFGESMRAFWIENREIIIRSEIDPFIW